MSHDSLYLFGWKDANSASIFPHGYTHLSKQGLSEKQQLCFTIQSPQLTICLELSALVDAT